MNYPFRTQRPTRAYSVMHRDYRQYKRPLAEDFNHRCGYADVHDTWFGGLRQFQIDHFRPKAQYPHLENEYANLVYCNPLANRAKWHDDSPLYLDPCEHDLNEHFYRNEGGEIRPVPRSENGNYMYVRLKLYLQIYSICWVLEQIEHRLRQAVALRNDVPMEAQGEINNLIAELCSHYLRWKDALHQQQNEI